MYLIVLIAGIFFFLLSTFIWKDWASGLAGFIYGTMIFGTILIVKYVLEQLSGQG